MSTRFLVLFVSLCWSATSADAQTLEQKRVAKECAGVPAERIDDLRQFVKKQPKDAPHGRVLKEARARSKGTGDIPAVPDGCVAAVVRELLVAEGRTSEQGQAEARKAREAAVRAAWDSLSENERRWVRFSLQRAAENRTLRCAMIAVGEMGYIMGDDKVEIVNIASGSEALAKIRGGVWLNAPKEAVRRSTFSDTGYVSFGPARRPDPDKPTDMSMCYDDPLIWLTNIDTARLANGSSIHLDKPIFVSGTHSYESVAGEQRTVFRVEVLDLDLQKLATIAPPPDAVTEATKKP